MLFAKRNITQYDIQQCKSFKQWFKSGRAKLFPLTPQILERDLLHFICCVCVLTNKERQWSRNTDDL